MTFTLTSNVYLPPVIQIPSSLEITAISNSNPMVITVSAMPANQVNTYIPGMLIKLTIPVNYGMWQAQGLKPQITAVTGNNLTVNVDSSQFDPFVVPPSGEQPASLAPSGSRNLAYSNSTSQIGFQSLNNIGN